jgi:voltage-gated potassium channel Kch
VNQHFVYGIALVFGTTLIHFVFTVGVIKAARSIERHPRAHRSATGAAAMIAALILVMSIAAYFESALWALFYVWIGALSSLDHAIYFSFVTLTTLGYGDVTLGEEWRVIGAFEAANGIILFGWTTALIVAVANRVMRIQPPRSDGS